MKKFRANYGNQIKEFEILKETEKQVVYMNEYKRECREAKISDWASWHNTKEEAIDYLVGKRRKEIESLNNRIDYLNTEINKIYKL